MATIFRTNSFSSEACSGWIAKEYSEQTMFNSEGFAGWSSGCRPQWELRWSSEGNLGRQDSGRLGSRQQQISTTLSSLSWEQIWYEDPELIWYEDPEQIWYEGPEQIWYEAPELIWYEGPQQIWYEGPEQIWYEGPQQIWYEAPEQIYMRVTILEITLHMKLQCAADTRTSSDVSRPEYIRLC